MGRVMIERPTPAPKESADVLGSVSITGALSTRGKDIVIPGGWNPGCYSAVLLTISGTMTGRGKLADTTGEFIFGNTYSGSNKIIYSAYYVGFSSEGQKTITLNENIDCLRFEKGFSSFHARTNTRTYGFGIRPGESYVTSIFSVEAVNEVAGEMGLGYFYASDLYTDNSVDLRFTLYGIRSDELCMS